MKFIIPGEPISQIRMKFSGRNGIGRIYDPRMKEKQDLKKWFTKKHFKPYFLHPRVSFIFHMPIPKSIKKKEIQLYNSGFLKHEKKPDCDNLAKLYLDCMDNICFEGDQKVSLGYCVKLYHPHPKTIIIMQETSQILSPLEVDPLTWFALFGKECGKCSSSEMDSLPDFYTPDQLEYSQCFDNSYPCQSIDSSETLPLVPPELRSILQVCR